MISRNEDRRRVISALVITLVVVLAGCAGLGSFSEGSSDQPPVVNGQDQSATPDASDESTTDSSSGSLSDPDAPTSHLSGDEAGTDRPLGPFPVGTSDQGITDSTALVAAHLGILEDSSYTVSRAETHTTADYTYSMESTLAVQGQRQRLSVDYEGQSQDIYRADNASSSFIRWETENGVRYLRDEGDVLFPGESAFFIQSLLEASTLEFVEHRTVDDHSVYVFSVTDVNNTQDLRDSTSLESVDELEGTVYVRDDGLIVGMDVVLTGRDFNGIVTELRIDETFSNIGTTTITEPTWLSKAQERAARMTASLSAQGEYIAITMEHGDAIPAGSTGFLYINDITLETTFEDGITPGQSFYIYETSGGELTVTKNAPVGSDVGSPVPEDVNEISVAIFHQEHGTVYASTLSFSPTNN